MRLRRGSSLQACCRANYRAETVVRFLHRVAANPQGPRWIPAAARPGDERGLAFSNMQVCVLRVPVLRVSSRLRVAHAQHPVDVTQQIRST